MDEFAITHVDTHMAECAAHGIEEHQITGLEVAAVDLLSGIGLFGRDARQNLAHGLGVDGPHKTAAVEAGFCIGAAQAIGNPKEAHGRHHQIGGFFGHVLTCFAHEISRLLGHGVSSFTQLGDEAAVDQQLGHVVVTLLARRCVR